MEREFCTVPVKAPGCRGAPHEVASACWRCLLDQSPWHPPYSQGSKCGAPAEDFRSFGRGRGKGSGMGSGGGEGRGGKGSGGKGRGGKGRRGNGRGKGCASGLP